MERKTRPDLGVAMIGHGFMGAVHSGAWESAPHAFDLPRNPAMRVLVGRDVAATAAAAQRLGWQQVATNWQAVLERRDIDVVDICTPSDSHAEIAVAALEAGKHVLCEKPLANTTEEASRMAEAAERASRNGARSMVGFNYRRVPAIAQARAWVAAGRLGTIYHVRAAYLQDWAANPQGPLVWRLRRERAGSGALGDLGSHVVDLAEFLLDDRLMGVTAIERTFVRERPLPDDGGWGKVDVDDCVAFSGSFADGALGTFEATRFAVGHRNALRIEISGSAGALAFDLEALNELWYYDAREVAASAGFRRVFVTEPTHPYSVEWLPPGHIIGWDRTFTNEVADFVKAIDADEDPAPSFADGLHIQQVLAAVSESAGNEARWTRIDAGDRVTAEVNR
jgi:predicted dehydrogenase